MISGTVMTHGKRSATGMPASILTRWMVIVVVALVAGLPAIAQNTDLLLKVAAVKQAAAANQERLRQYQWTEITQPTLNGDAKTPSQYLCQYGPDGQVQKTPTGAPPPPPSGGRLKQRIVENKKQEMQDYMGNVKAVLSMYVPPAPARMEQAFQAGKVSLNPGGGILNLVFRDYALPGDQMTLSFDPAAKQIVSVSVNTYMGQAKDAVTLQVQMATLPDGTSYAQRTTLNATAKQLEVVTTSFNYQKLGAY